nr:acyltransferase [Stenotrophomonas chelatiphaga]
MRADWVDYAKGIGIVLVVYGHVARGLVKARILDESDIVIVVDKVIYNFHMPLFFFLSGLYFLGSLRRKGQRGLLLNKLDTIAYPYIVWSLIQGAIEVTLSNFTNGSLAWSELRTILIEPRGQFWFLYALFIIFAVAVLLYRRSGQCHAVKILIIAVAINLASQVGLEAGVVRQIALNFAYFALGVVFNRVMGGKGLTDTPLAVGVMAWSIALYVCFYWINGATSDPSAVLAIILAVSGIGFVVSLSGLISRWSPSSKIAMLGALSMQIYLMHIIAGSGARVVLSKLLSISDPSVHLVIGVISGIVAPILVALVLKRLGVYWLYTPPRPLRMDQAASSS